MAQTKACNRKQAHDRIVSKTGFGIRNPESKTGYSFEGERVGNSYIVRSYGVIIGTYYFEYGTWQINPQRYSVTTSKHQGILRGAL